MYTQTNQPKKFFELYFKVLDGRSETSLQTLFTFIQDEIISKLRRILSQETLRTQLDLHRVSGNKKYSISIPNQYGVRVGAIQGRFGKTAFILEEVNEAPGTALCKKKVQYSRCYNIF